MDADQRIALLNMASDRFNMLQNAYVFYARRNPEFANLIGKKFGSLTVKDLYKDPKDGISMALCDCACGRRNVPIPCSSLYLGQRVSCGCSRTNVASLNPRSLQNANPIVATYDNGTRLEIKCGNDQSTFMVDEITWRYMHNFNWFLGKDNGYIGTCINSKQYKYHRLILSCPKGNQYARDHIDRNRRNNVYDNLRVVTRRDNVSNSTLRSTNQSGIKGVRWHPIRQKWEAKVNWPKFGLAQHSRYFESKEDAILYRRNLEEKYMQITPIETQRLVLPDGSLNQYYPYQDWPDFPWHMIGINLIYV